MTSTDESGLGGTTLAASPDESGLGGATLSVPPPSVPPVGKAAASADAVGWLRPRFLPWQAPTVNSPTSPSRKSRTMVPMLSQIAMPVLELGWTCSGHDGETMTTPALTKRGVCGL
jgi:hypothetical protein